MPVPVPPTGPVVAVAAPGAPTGSLAPQQPTGATASAPVPKIKDHLLIEPLIYRFNPGRLRLLMMKIFSEKWVNRTTQPMQGGGYKVGLRVTNYCDKPFPGGRIADFTISSTERQAASMSYTEAVITQLNPKQSTDIMLDKWKAAAGGVETLRCSVTPNDPTSREILTYQYNRETDNVDLNPDNPNLWAMLIYVESKADVLQNRSNNILITLTVLTFLQGTFGLDVIAKTIWHAIQHILLYIAQL